MSYVVVLGAPDPEMELIERLCREAGVTVVHALGPDGQRVRGDQAYQVTAPSAPLPAGDITVVAVECDGPAIPDGALIVDHHRPGDPGYGRPPRDYWEASSLGQVSALLGHAEPVATEHQLAAAADHCLAAAYRGDCPGVDPDALMRWRVATRAAFQGRSVEAVLADVEAARAVLRAAPRIDLGGESVADLRGQEIPELPEAAAREGIAFLATPRPRSGERQKVVLQCAGPAALAAWPRWAVAQGLVDLYGGDAARGFAGGYIREESSDAMAE